mgnify:CR=1 FL=1
MSQCIFLRDAELPRFNYKQFDNVAAKLKFYLGKLLNRQLIILEIRPT